MVKVGVNRDKHRVRGTCLRLWGVRSCPARAGTWQSGSAREFVVPATGGRLQGSSGAAPRRATGAKTGSYWRRAARAPRPPTPALLAPSLTLQILHHTK